MSNCPHNNNAWCNDCVQVICDEYEEQIEELVLLVNIQEEQINHVINTLTKWKDKRKFQS